MGDLRRPGPNSPARILLPSSTMLSSLGRLRVCERAHACSEKSPKRCCLGGKGEPRLEGRGAIPWQGAAIGPLSSCHCFQGPAFRGGQWSQGAESSNCCRERKGAASPGPEQGQRWTFLECLPLTLVFNSSSFSAFRSSAKGT